MVQQMILLQLLFLNKAALSVLRMVTTKGETPFAVYMLDDYEGMDGTAANSFTSPVLPG